MGMRRRDNLGAVAIDRDNLSAAEDPGPGETDNDGAPQAWEVTQFHLRADLVVLSACQTGGVTRPGEGFFHLALARDARC